MEIIILKEDLPEKLKLMADNIGLKNVQILLETFGGKEIYFPKNSLQKIATRKYINDNFGRLPIIEMARRINLSRQAIFNYLNTKKRPHRA